MTRPPYLAVVPAPVSTWPPSGLREQGEVIRRLVDYLTDCDRHDTESVMHAVVDIVNAATRAEVLINGHARDTAPRVPF